ncbi:NAD(P)/FAD-dependent oxidoreductase [Mycolicibacterium gilvum]|uniref:Flavin-dependent dehydrogenase n=1 Tax=Mycolicibacterium gilvum TaxID=1804 RepID=A0A378SHH4_9MYCO|nr:NAD(P)/FAD-dependent oxidoreductase [Mycolicibacterium gilvum]MCV7054729.1 NAD(P)/FAD-dependent oxidoreductase [Mycolicibacterium gilvum]STZ40827.1 flavin-dependent dehydrogenase [Mycolicibacterium gilvum]
MESFDVVVVGARCAGSALAIYLARAGMRVCLIDKAAFPSETPSTHVLQPRGVAILDELGALEPLLARSAAQLDRFSVVIDDIRIDGVLDDRYTHPGLNVRRTILDQALLQIARDAGADVRTRCRVTGARRSGGRVIGIDTAHGPLEAGLVVGADGRGSVIAESVGAHKYLVKPAGRIPVWGYFATGPHEPRLRIGRKGNLAFLASPTDSGLYMATVAVDHDAAHNFHRDREANFRNAIRAWPELDDIVGGAERDGPLRVMANWHSYFRESAGPGWVLVGDAGHFKDFTPGQGISDALCQAKALSTAISASAGSATAQDEAMKRWWQHRDRSSYDMYWFAMQMAPPGAPSPLVTELLRRVANDPDGAATLLRVINRDLQSTKLFTTSRLLAAACTTLLNHPEQRRATFAEIRAQLATEIEKFRARLSSSRGRNHRIGQRD